MNDYTSTVQGEPVEGTGKDIRGRSGLSPQTREKSDRNKMKRKKGVREIFFLERSNVD